MTVELRDIPSKLEILVRQISDDTDIEIKNNIMGLIAEARTLSNTFSDVMQNEGSVVLQTKRALMTAYTPSQVDVQKLKYALKSLQTKLQDMRDAMFVFQGHVHIRVEECRTRSRQHKHDIELKKLDIIRLKRQIGNLEEQIQTCVSDAAYEDRRADSFEADARKLDEKAETHVGVGIVSSIAIVGVGLVGAPFTGGASLAIAGGAAAGNLGGHLYCASECTDKAKSHRQTANQKRKEAERHRQTKRNSESDIANKEREVNTLKQKNERIANTCTKLNEIEQHLYIAIGIIDAVITNVQNLDTTLFAAERQGDSFKIIQSAFGKNPQRLEGRAQHYLAELKGKWECVEKDLEQAQELRSIRN